MVAQGDWTFESLLLHVQVLIAANDRRYEEHFTSLTTAMLTSVENAQEAVERAAAATERRFDASNAFRGQLADQAATLIPRAEAEARLAALGNLVEAVRSTVEKSAFVTREFFDRYTKEQTDVQARFVDTQVTLMPRAEAKLLTDALSARMENMLRQVQQLGENIARLQSSLSGQSSGQQAAEKRADRSRNLMFATIAAGVAILSVTLGALGLLLGTH